MNDNERLLLDNQLCFALYSTSLAMTQTYKDHLEALGLTYTQYTILMILWENDGLTLKEVADRLGQKSGSLTPVIKRMETDDLVLRERGQIDDRQLNIILTDKGKSLQAEAMTVNNCITQACNISENQLISLRDQLVELRHSLKNK